MRKIPFVGTPPPPQHERPNCEGCGKRMVPLIQGGSITTTREREAGAPHYLPRSWDGRYKGYGAFCTMRCATAYANRVVRRDDVAR